jgi:glutathionylspermidine synthase
MMDTAIQAGVKSGFIYINDIGFNEVERDFVDLDGNTIRSIFKLYPYEWLIHEEFGKFLLETYNKVYWIEPIWKMIMSNKAFMVILSRLYPNHPNILQASFEPSVLKGDYVKKPMLSREGANITIVRDGHEVSTDGEYGEEGYIYQQYIDIPKFDDKTPIIGSWVIDSHSAGIGIREGDIITDNRSSFVPHIIE